MNFPHPPMIHKPFCTWGMHTDFRIDFKRNKCTNFVLINNCEYLLLTLTQTLLCEKGSIKETSPIKLLAAVYIPSYDFLVGVSSTNNDFVVFRRSDIENPYFTNIHIGQLGVFHMLFSSRTNTIITVGQDIRTWRFSCLHPEVRLLSPQSEILIDFNSVIPISADSSMMNSPCFDYQLEEFILPSSRGYKRISIDGQFSEYATKLSSTDRTTIAYYPPNNSIATSDIIDGTCLWLSGANLILREHFTENPLISLRFVNEEFLLVLDIQLDFYLINLYTEEIFYVMELNEKPKSISFYASYGYKLAIVFDSSFVVYNVVVPWHLWQKNIIQPNTIKMHHLPYSPSRIAIQRDIGVISLVSPKTKTTLTTASFQIHRRISKFFYDRHIENDKLIDRILVLLKNGYVAFFQTKSIKCELIKEIDLGAVSIFGFFINDAHYYGVGTMIGDLVFYKSINLEVEKRFTILRQSLVGAFYDKSYDTMIMIYDSVLVRYDYKKMQILQKIQVQGGDIVEVDNNFIVMGYPNGLMNFIEIRKDFLRLHINEGKRYHLAPITDISFGRNYFVSASLDSTIKIWSYKGTNISTITLPFPVLGIEILNGRRDMIFGTEKELMIIEGRNIFSDPYESEDPALDNYNRLDDFIPDQIQFEHEEIEEEAFCTISNESFSEIIVYPELLNETKEVEHVNKIKSQSQVQKLTEDMKDKIMQQMLLMSTAPTPNNTNKPKLKEEPQIVQPNSQINELNKSQTLIASRKDIQDWIQTESKRKKKSSKKSPKKKNEVANNSDSHFDIKTILNELRKEKQLNNENQLNEENNNELQNDKLNEKESIQFNTEETFLEKENSPKSNSNQNSFLEVNENSKETEYLVIDNNLEADQQTKELNLDEINLTKTEEKLELNQNETEINKRNEQSEVELNRKDEQSEAEINKKLEYNEKNSISVIESTDMKEIDSVNNEIVDNNNNEVEMHQNDDKSPVKYDTNCGTKTKAENNDANQSFNDENPIIQENNFNSAKEKNPKIHQMKHEQNKPKHKIVISSANNSSETQSSVQNDNTKLLLNHPKTNLDNSKGTLSNNNHFIENTEKLSTNDELSQSDDEIIQKEKNCKQSNKKRKPLSKTQKPKVELGNKKKKMPKSKKNTEKKNKHYNLKSKTLSYNNQFDFYSDESLSSHHEPNIKSKVVNNSSNNDNNDLIKPDFNFPDNGLLLTNELSNEYGSSEGDDSNDFFDQIPKPIETLNQSENLIKPPKTANILLKSPRRNNPNKNLSLQKESSTKPILFKTLYESFSPDQFIYNDYLNSQMRNNIPKRSRTPPLIKPYSMHIPNYIYDVNSIIREIENGNLSLLPLLERIKRNGELYINTNYINEMRNPQNEESPEENFVQCNYINFPDYLKYHSSTINGRHSQLYFKKNLFEDENIDNFDVSNRNELIPKVSKTNYNSDLKNLRFNRIKQTGNNFKSKTSGSFDVNQTQTGDCLEEINKSMIIRRLIKPNMDIKRRRNRNKRKQFYVF